MYLDLLTYKDKIEEQIQTNKDSILLCDLLKPLNGFTIKQEKKFLDVFNGDKTICDNVNFIRNKKDGAYGENSIVFISKSNSDAKIKYKISTSSFVLNFEDKKKEYQETIKRLENTLSFFKKRKDEIDFFNKTLANIKKDLTTLHTLEQSIVKEYNTSKEKEDLISLMSRELKNEILKTIENF